MIRLISVGCIALFALTVVCGGIVLSQGKSSKEEYVDVARFKAVKVLPDGDEKLGVYDTEEEAEKRCQEWHRENPKNNALTAVRKIQVRIYPNRKGRTRQDSTQDSPPTSEKSLTPGTRVGPKRPIIVKVYMLVNGEWKEVLSSRYETPDNYGEASKYYLKVKGMNGYTATWNAPGWPVPKIEKPKVPNVDIRRRESNYPGNAVTNQGSGAGGAYRAPRPYNPPQLNWSNQIPSGGYSNPGSDAKHESLTPPPAPTLPDYSGKKPWEYLPNGSSKAQSPSGSISGGAGGGAHHVYNENAQKSAPSGNVRHGCSCGCGMAHCTMKNCPTGGH